MVLQDATENTQAIGAWLGIPIIIGSAYAGSRLAGSYDVDSLFNPIGTVALAGVGGLIGSQTRAGGWGGASIGAALALGYQFFRSRR